MHELAVCQALIGQVTDVAQDNKASTVSDIYVSVGPLSGVEAPLLQNAFPIAAAGTVANAATLHLDATPIRVHCEECGAESEVKMNRLVCKECGDWRTTLISGDELLLQRVVLGEINV
ncbi:MAG: hydrogenase nickel incorporation protein HypA [Woeseiaceae bacterium]|jgi:hydrogenase nickel incorporation protein HypA/HybF|nr:hydrogenase nickel incorporation protein HypA [Woeseiaceae bacterium]